MKSKKFLLGLISIFMVVSIGGYQLNQQIVNYIDAIQMLQTEYPSYLKSHNYKKAYDILNDIRDDEVVYTMLSKKDRGNS